MIVTNDQIALEGTVQQEVALQVAAVPVIDQLDLPLLADALTIADLPLLADALTIADLPLLADALTIADLDAEAAMIAPEQHEMFRKVVL
jgi:hypothetical protein